MSGKIRIARSRAFLAAACLGYLFFAGGGRAQVPQLSGFDPASQRKTAADSSKQAGTQNANGSVQSNGSSGLEALKLPQNAIIVICDDPREAARLSPKAILLTPQQYQRLLEQSEQLKRDSSNARIENPSVCRISGKIDGNLARVRAHFEFATNRPGALVNLGCQRAWPTAASLDGQLPALQVGDEGFVLQVPRAGTHQATLDMVLPVASRRDARGNDRGLELDLPRAAISVLESFEFPGKVSEVRMGTRLLRTGKQAGTLNGIESTPIVPIDHLDLGWKSLNTEAANAPPILTADAHVLVRVTETHVVTEAELTLQPLGGTTAQWKLRMPVPPDAEVDVKALPPEDPRVRSIETTGAKDDPSWTIKMKEPSAERFQLRVRLRQRRTSQPVSVGPFTISDAQIQKGEIEVRAVDDVRLRYIPYAEVSRREVSEEQRRNNVRAVFAYWSLPPVQGPSSPSPALLQLHVEPLKGTAEARVVHALRLSESGLQRQLLLKAATRFEINPIRTRVDRVQISLPAEFVYDQAVGARPAELIEDFVVDAQNRTAQFKLAQKQDRPFTLTIEGSYALTPGQRSLTIKLPRPLACAFERTVATDSVLPPTIVQFPLLDRGGQVSVVLPEGFELLAERFQTLATPGLTGSLQPFFLPLRPRFGTREYSWQTERLPEHLDLAWRPHAPEFLADSTVDVTLSDRSFLVVQKTRLRVAAGMPTQTELGVPAEIRERLRMVSGAVLPGNLDRSQSTWNANLVRTEGAESALVMEYVLDRDPPHAAAEGEVQAGDGGNRIPVPLVGVLGASHHDLKVRVWSDAPADASVVGEGWNELPTEVVAGHDRLPACVGSSTGQSPLVLRVAEPSAAAVLGVTVVDRVLARVAISDSGNQFYQIRFLVNQLAANTLDLELPTSLTGANLDVRLDEKRLPVQVVDETGREVSIGRIAKVYLEPQGSRQPHVLTVQYQCDVTRIPGNGFFHGMVAPPLLRKAVLLGRARWQFDLPDGVLPIITGRSCQAEWTWSWQNGLLRPHAALRGTDLARWFTGKESDLDADAADPSLLCWQADLAPISFWQISERLWLLACSIPFLALGLVLVFAPLSRPVFWGAILSATVSVGALGILRPGLLPALAYGCQPSVPILFLVVVVQFLSLLSHRRRGAIAPGFSRSRAATSLVTASNGNSPREPSTVDQPPKRGSSVSSEIRA